MKRFITWLVLLSMILSMSACSLATKISELSSLSSETEQLLEQMEKSQATEAPPSPMPISLYITAYEDISQDAKSKLEALALEALEKHFQSEQAMDGTFQSRTVTGTGGRMPDAEDFVRYEAELDSVYVLSGGESGSAPNNQIVYLYLVTAEFDTQGVSDWNAHQDLFMAISIDDVTVDESGTCNSKSTEAQILQIVDPKFYDFYDLYEETILARQDAYSVSETVVSDAHQERMESREMEKQYIDGFLMPLLNGEMNETLWAGLFNSRKMIEADIRKVNAAQMQKLWNIYNDYIEKVRTDKNYGYIAENYMEYLEYNLAFLEAHLEAMPIIEETPVPTQTSSPTPAPTPTEEPIQQDSSGFTGTWKVDTQKTNAMNDEAILFHFGSMIKQSSMEMTVGESGFFAFGLGAAGGEGTYTIEDGKLIARYMPYNGQQEVTMSIDKVVEEGIEYLLMTMEADGYLVYWKKQ